MVNISINRKSLYEFAKSQTGYFTSKQAHSFNYATKNFPYHVKKGNWLKIDRGLYRLPNFEDTLDSLFTRWSLWSRNRSDQPQAVISHKSALMYYGIISEDMAKPIHLTVPKEFQKRNIPADGIILHKDNLSLSELENHGSFMTTKLFRTLKDTKKDLEQKGIWTKITDKAYRSGMLSAFATWDYK
jgi:predicted transcriptional regulator of viral defense system